MTICLIIKKDKFLWAATLNKLHLLGFKWYRTGQSLDEFRLLDRMLESGAKGIGINFKDKTVAWTSEPSKYYKYFIEIKK